jgi:hypothetical protein
VDEDVDNIGPENVDENADDGSANNDVQQDMDL